MGILFSFLSFVSLSTGVRALVQGKGDTGQYKWIDACLGTGGGMATTGSDKGSY